ncbi:MAG: tRNA isopentenyl-2-thiomethyl-A-37 hydroxylase MiaE [Planctomycetota bacterium]|jgi:tRNA-(ms[2]io[6]A)-hydroxylase
MLGLTSRTNPDWAKTALSNEIALLRDHAHLERKAALQVLMLVGQVTWATDELMEVVQEEMEHFERVCAILKRRGEQLGPDHGNPYVQRLSRVTKNALLDRILRMGLIEARSYERFALLADAAEGELGDLFGELKDSEAGHHAFFIKLAYEKWPREEVKERWYALCEQEAEIIGSLPWGARIH